MTAVEALSLTDEQVVDRVIDGDTALFELIMRRYNQRLFRAARAILGNDAEADDAVQQAYISAYVHLQQFHGDARFSTWLTRIGIHSALARMRALKRRSEVDFEPAVKDPHVNHGGSHDDNPEQLTGRREIASLVEAAVDELPEIYRVVFMLREVQQLSTAETADCLEVSEEVVKIRLHRGKAMLRQAVAAQTDVAGSDAFEFLGARCDRIVARVLERLIRDSLPARKNAIPG